MDKEIIAVYQDCVLCGTKGRQKITECASKGITIRKVGLTTEEGKKLIHEAVFKHGIGQMPFYVYGDVWSNKLRPLIELAENAKKPTAEIPKEQKIVKKVRKKAVLEKKTEITDEDMEDGTSAEV